MFTYPILLYALEVCNLNKSTLQSLGFTLNRFFMKLFKTSNMEIVTYCQRALSKAGRYCVIMCPVQTNNPVGQTAVEALERIACSYRNSTASVFRGTKR